jgi:enoyl-CoA hydratase
MLQQTDSRIADEHAVVGLPEAEFGLIAGAGSTVRLKRQMPYTKAMEMILTGEPLTAAEAYHFRLVGHVVPKGHSLARARKIAARVADNGPLAVRNATLPFWPAVGSTTPTPERSNNGSSSR